MTPDDLERLVALGDIMGLADAVADLEESERKTLSKTAQSLRRELEKCLNGGFDGRPSLNRVLQSLGKTHVRINEQILAADLALLAVGPLSCAKRVSILRGAPEEAGDPVLKVLSDRRPEWADQWLATAISGEYPAIAWSTLRGLIMHGVCRKPTSDDYYQAMVERLPWPDWKHRQPRRISDTLASEPDLLEDVYRLFEVETSAFTTGFLFEKDNSDYESWPTAIATLAERDLLDRDRLLDATLSGQMTGLRPHILGGFARMHDYLKPTIDEMTGRQSTYCDLLSVPVPHVVSFALKLLKKVDQKKRLDDTLFVAAVTPVFGIKTKGASKTAIGILKNIAKRRPELIPDLCRKLVDAIGHPSEDVQDAAASLLATLADQLDQDLVSALAERLDMLAATVRPRVAELIEKAGGRVNTALAAGMGDEEDITARLADCQAQAKALDPHWRRLAGVDTALTALEHGHWAPPPAFSPIDVPVLSGVEPVEPIETVDELIDAVAHAIEKIDSCYEAERILDGISRLCDQRPDDFDRRVAPLIARIKKLAESDNNRGMTNPHNGLEELENVVTAWLSGSVEERRHIGGTEGRPDRSIMRFLNLRLKTLRERVIAREAAPLLAAPTHRGGWIDPNVLVSRWQESEQRGATMSRQEVILALLRIAPWPRDQALRQAASLHHPWAAALRWALGSNRRPTDEAKKESGLWLAAGRARSPQGRLDALSAAGLNELGPDGICPAQYQWQAAVEAITSVYSSETAQVARLSIKVSPQSNGKYINWREHATVLLHTRLSKWNPFETIDAWGGEWASTVWPARLDAFYAIGIRSMMLRLNDLSSMLAPNFHFLAPLYEVDRPWSPMAQLIALVGANSRDQDVRGATTDALINAIADGRLHPEPLGETLATLATPQWLKLNRLCEMFAEVARVSPLHAWVAMGTLERLLVEFEELPRDVHHLLALLQELHAQLGLPASQKVTEKLKSVTGASKTAKLAKALLSSPPASTRACREARLLTLEARLARARRWADAAGDH